jgi:hypothetical protein
MEDTNSVTAKEGIEIFGEILGHPISNNTFYYLVSSGQIAAVNSDKRSRRYARSDVERLALERKETDGLLDSNAAIERIRKAGVPVQYHEFRRIMQSGRIKPSSKKGREIYFKPEDIDALIPVLRADNEKRSKGTGLMKSREAVAWINRRLEQEHSEERIKLSTFYNWVDREIIPYDFKVPGKNGRFRNYTFSEESLLQAPVFHRVPVMPDEDINPVRITGSHTLRQLEEKWGDLITVHGIKELELSPWFVGGKKRTVRPVGYDGITRWFPKRYVPPKRYRSPNRKSEFAI